jgi:hypothetical protein
MGKGRLRLEPKRILAFAALLDDINRLGLLSHIDILLEWFQ